MYVLNMFNFEKICRTCSSEEEDLKSIFEEKDLDIPAMIMAIADVNITKEDGLPSNICLNCLSCVESAYLFKKQCEESNSKFLSVLQLNNELSSEEENNEIELKIECDDFDIQPKIGSDESNHESDSSYVNELPFHVQLTNGHERKSIRNKRIVRKNHSTIDSKHICPFCGKTFAFKQRLNQHLPTHTKEKQFHCKTCKKSFSLRSNLSRHIKIHTGEKPHACDVCGKRFIQHPTLIQHLKVHNRTTSTISTTTDRKPYKRKNGTKAKLQCDICDKWYSSRPALNTHKLVHGEKSFLCSDCGKGFVTRAGLQSHSKVHTGVKPYTCDICNKTFSQMTILKDHKRVHTGERPFVCQVCSKAFTQRTHLKYHLRIHKGERPYECSVCGKKFTLNGTLTVHMRIHTGEKPYVCSVCNKGFYDSSSMKKHRAKHELNNYHIT